MKIKNPSRSDFENQGYTLAKAYYSEDDALKHAKELRKKGYTVKIEDAGNYRSNWWAVWIKRRRGNNPGEKRHTEGHNPASSKKNGTTSMILICAGIVGVYALFARHMTDKNGPI
jgi:hypothetical protein